jgi:hypothetical protein
VPNMKIDPNELRVQAGKLNAAGADLTTKLATAINGLNGLGNFWGDDDTGHIFYNGDSGHPGYRTQHDNVSTDTNAIITGYGEIASGLEQTAKNVDVANWNALVALPKVPA